MPNEEEKKQETPNDKKEELAQAYGIDLTNIQHIRIDNGRKEFYKIEDPKTRTVKLIEVYDKGLDAKTNFEQTQKGLSFAQGTDSKNNAKDILEHDLKYKHHEVPLITMTEMKSNRFKYKRLLNRLDTITRKKVKAILRGASKGNIDLRYISLENAIAISSNGTVIEATYDYVTNSAVIKGAEVVNTYDQKFSLDKDVDAVELSEEELNGLFECIAITSDGPTLINDKNIIIKGESINSKTVINLYNMPETINRIGLSSKQINIYKFIIGALLRRVGKKKDESNEKGQSMQLVKKNTSTTSSNEEAA